MTAPRSAPFDPAQAGLSTTAMVLAAGEGSRLRPLTLTKPKPLFEVGGRAMLDHALDHLKAVGVRRVVVNACYLADQIAAHCEARRDLTLILSREAERLDTGGGLKNARRWFDGKPFFALNADLPWFDGPVPALERLGRFWDPERMDAALLLMPTLKARGFPDTGDFMLEPDGRVWRKNAPVPRSHVWISAQILAPHLLDEVEETIFSTNRLWDAAEARGRLAGLAHDGTCYHVGAPGDLAEANRLLATGEGWRVP